MTRAKRKVTLGLGAALLGLWSMMSAALAANCVPSNITLFTVSSVTMGNYSPYSSAPLTATFTVTISTNANCTNLFFAVTAAGGTFAPTAPGLSYTLPGSPPTPGNELKVNVHNTTVTRTFTVQIAPGQLAPAGSHTTSNAPAIRANLYLRERGDLIQPPARSAPVYISVFVQPACQLPAPSLSTVDFTAALTTGLPNPAIVRSVVFTGASCLAPTRIRISGAALQPAAATPPRAGFDALINWQAQATFGLATAVLATTGTTPTQATSTTRNTSGSGSTSGNIQVNINLLPGTRPQAGSYSGTLTVTIDPTL
jgi:hypothetical protein